MRYNNLTRIINFVEGFAVHELFLSPIYIKIVHTMSKTGKLMPIIMGSNVEIEKTGEKELTIHFNG
jgi:hypothetical protein